MNTSHNCNNNNYIINLMENIICTCELDSSNSVVPIMSSLKRDSIQNWVNNNDFLRDSEVLIINSNNTINMLQLMVDKFELPSLDLVHCLSLKEISAYEIMLIEIVNNIPPIVNLSVNIMLHLKIITNHLIFKFQIFS
jgi:hypothetical protein